MKITYTANILIQCAESTLRGTFFGIPPSNLELSPPF